MTHRFVYNIDQRQPSRLVNYTQQHSTSVASPRKVNMWLSNVKRHVEEFDSLADNDASVTKSVAAFYRDFLDVEHGVLTALSLTNNGAGGVPLHSLRNTPDPIGFLPLKDSTKAQIYDAFDAYIDGLPAGTNFCVAGNAAIGPGPPPVVAVPSRQQLETAIPNPIELTMDEQAFNDFHWQLLEAMAHSGFSGVGDYNQDIVYTLRGEPDIDFILTMRAGDIIGRCLPPQTTPFNIGAAFADLICRTAKQYDIEFDWGKKHGVPSSMNHLGFSCWMFITDKTLINDEQRVVMHQVSATAIRDSYSPNMIDPLLPDTSINENKKAMANVSMLNQQLRSNHGYKPSDVTRQSLNNFRFGGSSGFNQGNP